MATPYDKVRFSDGLAAPPQIALHLVVDPTPGDVPSATAVPPTIGSSGELIDAITAAVQAAGGDLSDVVDLLQVWERVQTDSRGRVERMRFEASHPRCGCIDGGEPGDADERLCVRCYGTRLE